MSKFQVRFFTGDYGARQAAANAAGVIGYVEQHFNWSSSANVNGTEVILASDASQTSRAWAARYASLISKAFSLPLRGDKGLVVGGYGGRGTFNVRKTKMPAILLEPLFVSSPEGAHTVKSEQGRHALALALVESIRQTFPDGGTVGFSVGHKGKESDPFDRGADVYGGGTEADYAEMVLKEAAELLVTDAVAAAPAGEAVVTPEAVVTVQPDISVPNLRSRIGEQIVKAEGRYEGGKLGIYKLAPDDGGGTYEIAGINDRYHPREAAKLKEFIDRGQHEAAEALAAEYILSYTEGVRAWFPSADIADNFPGIEFFLRDCAFNRGPTGAAKILQYSIGAGVDGQFGATSKKLFWNALEKPADLLRKLRASREWYERAFAHRSEASRYWKGLVNRWEAATDFAQKLEDEN